MGMYNDPTGGSASSIGNQQRTDFIQRKALTEAARERYFGQMADSTVMPKFHGKEIIVRHYLPLLDDRNVNDQGLDASGATIVDGNLYGSSKDVGKILGRIPYISEEGGRQNRVGFKRQQVKGTFKKLGFFRDWTEDSLSFDSDPELEMHLNREMLLGANEIVEDLIQADLLNAPGVIYYGGNATSEGTITGEGTASVITYADIMRVSTQLDDNRTPTSTKIMTGSQMTDTRTIQAGRPLYIGTELESLCRKMTDYHGAPAFIDISQYASQGMTYRGEIGSIGKVRIIVVPEMQHWAGVGAAETGANLGYRAEGGNYNVYPMLIVGGESFTTVGFQTGGSTVKFTINRKNPGEGMVTIDDPYGEQGLASIKWWYGFLVLRPERIAVLKTVAEI